MCLWSSWEGRRRHDREVSVDLCTTWPESWCKRLSREMTWSSSCSGGITLTVLRMDGWGLEGLWTVKVTWARVRMFWTRVQELEEGGNGGNWDIFWKWSQHYSPANGVGSKWEREGPVVTPWFLSRSMEGWGCHQLKWGRLWGERVWEEKSRFHLLTDCFWYVYFISIENIE